MEPAGGMREAKRLWMVVGQEGKRLPNEDANQELHGFISASISISAAAIFVEASHSTLLVPSHVS